MTSTGANLLCLTLLVGVAAAAPSQALVCGETALGTLASPGEVDSYEFAASAGDVVGVSIADDPGTPAALNVGAELLAPSSTPVAFVQGASCGPDRACESAALPETGTYTLRVSDAGADASGTYSLTLEALSGDGSAACLEAQAIACDEEIPATLAPKGDSDVYTFSAEAGEQALLRVVGGVAGSSAWGALFAPDGASVTLTFPPGGGGMMSEPLPASGDYRFRLVQRALLDPTFPGSVSSSYELLFVSLEGSASCSLAVPIHCGASVTGSVAPDQVHVRSFVAEAGDRVFLSHGPSSTSTYPQLFGPDGSRIFHTGFDPLPLSGVYTMTASGNGTFAQSYRQTLDAVTASFNGGSNGPPSPVCAVSDGTFAIGCGQTVSGTVGSGDQDAYTFFGTTGDQLGITLVGTGVLSELRGPDGSPVQSTTLRGSGVYTLLVHRTSPGTASYSLTLNRTPCASDCNDGGDDDADGKVDFPADTGCTSAEDPSEQPECADGLDNDGDGGTDAGDPGCATPAGASEDPACDDGQDNDGDRSFDFDGANSGSADAYCMAASTPVEAPPLTCGIGPELLALLPLLRALRRRQG